MKRHKGIAWTEETWNPTTGCDRVSPGCQNCYAADLAVRLKAMGNPRYQKDGEPPRSGPGFGFTLHPDKIDEPRGWRKARIVFVNSMSDLFHEEMPMDFLQAVFRTMVETPRHTYQVLTKRSKRLQLLAPELPWPPNVWMGVSVENQRYSFRARHLAETKGPAVKFLSVEPLIGPVDDLPLDSIDWVIVGAESGPSARPMDEDWVRSVRDQCLSHPDRPAFFYKQKATSDGRKIELPELDGDIWDEMPDVAEPFRLAQVIDLRDPRFHRFRPWRWGKALCEICREPRWHHKGES